ncbi:MAG: ThiF family adenylyltransferase [Fuscovulum sp.]|nr:ThiF family adenylyltransferase [Fuscovulum sp.]
MQMTPPLYAEGELPRYARHIVLREIGGPGQARLKRASVLVVGAGGLGAPVLMYLAAAGVGRITLVDDDRASLSNLQRRVIHAQDRLGMPKVESARIALAGINPFVTLSTIEARLDAETAARLAAEAIKLIVGAGRSLRGRLMLQDVLWGENREIAIHRRADCAVCGAITEDPA